MGIIEPPRLLLADDSVDDFDCNISSLNDWLRKRANKNQENGASRTFVICSGNRVVGFYAIASGAVDRTSTPKAISRNMPQPIPVIVLGRLAVDRSFQNQRLGSFLLKDAILRAELVSQSIGVRAIVVHAINAEAKSFYEQYGFIESPFGRMTLFLPISRTRPD